MSPFSITCETCHAKLRVRDEAAVGQIHACPKCDSMVHVVPQRAARQAPLVDSPASTVTAATPDFEVPDLINAAAESSAPAEADPPAEPMPAPPEIGINRSLLVWGSASGIGVFVLGGVVGALLLGRPQPVPESSAVPATTEVFDEPNKAERLTAKETTPTALPDATLPDVEQPNRALETTEPFPIESTVADSPASEAPPPALGGHSAPPVENTRDAATDEIQTAATDDPPQASDASAEQLPARKLDLLNFDPAHLELAVGVAGRLGGIDGRPRQTSASDTPADIPSVDEESLPIAPAAPQPDVRAPARRGPTIDALVVNSEDQLQLPIEAFESTDAKLFDLLDVVAGLARVPITLPPETLAMTGIGADQPVTVSAEQTTVNGLLGDVLSPLRLQCVERGGIWRIERMGYQKRREAKYDVTDLVTPDTGTDTLAQWIRNLAQPDSWSTGGGQGTLELEGNVFRIEQTQQAHVDVLILLERLLLARNLPAKSRYPRARLSIESPYTAMRPTLSQSATFTFLPWTPLREVFSHWQRTTGLIVLVDWHALADVQLRPESLVAGSQHSVSWEEALDAFLAPLELTWRAVDDHTIEITTRAAAAAQQSVEFYPVADLVAQQSGGAEHLIASLERQLHESVHVGAEADRCHFVYDPVSGHLVVLGSAAVQRQLSAHLATL